MIQQTVNMVVLPLIFLPTPHELGHFVAQGDGRLRPGVYGLGDLP